MPWMSSRLFACHDILSDGTATRSLESATLDHRMNDGLFSAIRTVSLDGSFVSGARPNSMALFVSQRLTLLRKQSRQAVSIDQPVIEGNV